MEEQSVNIHLKYHWYLKWLLSRQIFQNRSPVWSKPLFHSVKSTISWVLVKIMQNHEFHKFTYTQRAHRINLQGNWNFYNLWLTRLLSDHLCLGRDCHELCSEKHFAQSPLQINTATEVSEVDGFVACDIHALQEENYWQIGREVYQSQFSQYMPTLLSQGRIDGNKRQRFSSIRIPRIV